MASRSRVGAVVLTAGLFGAGIAGLAVQAIAQPANHPQVEMARAAASRLDGGAKPSDVLPARKVDIGSSADAYLIVTNADGAVLASSASLSGGSVVPPDGVFTWVGAHGEDRLRGSLRRESVRGSSSTRSGEVT